MRLALIFLCAIACYGQMWPFPGPGRPGATGGGGGGSATFKGVTSLNQSTSASSWSTAGTLNVAAGDLIVVMVGSDAGTNTDPTYTVACGADSLTLARSWFLTNNYTIKAFYKENASANAAATCTATISVGPARTYRTIVAANYSGVVTSSALQASSCHDTGCNTLSASTTNRTAQNVSNTTANALLVALGVDWDGGVTPTGANSFTVRHDGSTEFLLDKNVTSIGSYPGGNFATVNAADEYAALFLVFGVQ